MLVRLRLEMTCFLVEMSYFLNFANIPITASSYFLFLRKAAIPIITKEPIIPAVPAASFDE